MLLPYYLLFMLFTKKRIFRIKYKCFSANFRSPAKKNTRRNPLIRFPQMLYYHLHLRLEQVLAVLVVAYGAEFLLHGWALPYPAPEVPRGCVLRHVGEIHHRQFVLLIGSEPECLLRLFCL